MFLPKSWSGPQRVKEVTDSVIDSPRSIVYDQAEKRLHVQKAIMLMLLG